MIRYYCDRCNKPLSEAQYLDLSDRIVLPEMEIHDGKYQFKDDAGLILCDFCLEDYHHFLKGDEIKRVVQID